MEKRASNVDNHDQAERLEAVHTHIGLDNPAELPRDHREYLQQRHGTLQLDPLPDMSDADPYNWTRSKVCDSTVNGHYRHFCANALV